MLNALLYFETTAPQKPNCCQILRLLIPCKNWEGMSKLFKSKKKFSHWRFWWRFQISNFLLHFETGMRQRRLLSKSKAKFCTFWPPEILGWSVQMFEWIFQVHLGPNLWWTIAGSPLASVCLIVKKWKGQRRNIKSPADIRCATLSIIGRHFELPVRFWAYLDRR